MIIAGSTSNMVPVLLRDTTSTTGGGLSGLVYNTANLVAEYRREGQSSWTAISLSAGTLGTYSSGGFVADGSRAGAYELGLPDAAVAAGVRWVAVRLRGAANMLAETIMIPLPVFNLFAEKVTPIDVGGQTYTEYVSAILAGVGGLSGSGANVVTVTVADDDENPLQNATVRMSEGVNSFTAATNGSGVATFALDSATYTLAITKAGYSFTPASRVVDGAEAFEEEMTQVAITPAGDPSQTVGYLTTYDAQGAAQASVVIEFQLLEASGDPGRSFPGVPFSSTSDANGNLTVDLLRETRYQARRNRDGGFGEWVAFTTDDASTYQLPEVIGAP